MGRGRWREREIELEAPSSYPEFRRGAWELTTELTAAEAMEKLPGMEGWAWQVDVPRAAIPASGSECAEAPETGGGLAVAVHWLQVRCPRCGAEVRLGCPGQSAFQLHGDADGGLPVGAFRGWDGPEADEALGYRSPAREALRLLRQCALPTLDRTGSVRVGSHPAWDMRQRCPLCGEEFLACFQEGAAQEPDAGHDRPRAFLIERVGAHGSAEAVGVRTVGSGGPERIVLDLDTGLAWVDGRAFLKTSAADLLGLSVDVCRGSSMVHDRAVLRAVVDAAESARPELQAGRDRAGELQWVDIAERNRFLGYPEGFYSDAFVQAGSASCFYGCACNLPRRYEDLAPFYSLSGLPDCKSIRRLAFERPAFIALALCADRPPFENVDLLRRLMAHRHGPRYFALTADKRFALFWRALAELKGERAVWRWMEGRDPRDFPDEGAMIGLHDHHRRLGELAADFAPDLKVASIMEAAPLMAAAASDGRASLVPYGYGERQTALAASVGGFDFSLPASPAELARAGAELRSCLSCYADRVPDQSVIVLVRSRDALVAAVELDGPCRQILQKRAARNERIDPAPPLGMAIAEWFDAKRLPDAAAQARRHDAAHSDPQ